MIKIGIIGTGFMGQTHAQCYRVLQDRYDFRVTAVADAAIARAAALAEPFGAKAYQGGLALIDEAYVDTVDICLPTYLHTEHMVAAMERGYNVLVEKPVCLNGDEAARLLSVRQNTGSRVMVAHCIRFWNEYVYLKGLVESHEYGDFVSGSFYRLSPRPNWYWDGWGHDRARSGSAVLDMHIHDVDFVRYLWGEPDRIRTMVGQSGRNGDPEHIFTLYRYGEKTVSIEGGWDYPESFPFRMGYRVKLQKAIILFDSNAHPGVRVFPDNGKEFSPEFPETAGISSGYYNEIDYFLQTIAAGREIGNASLEDAVDSLCLLFRETEAG